MTQEQNELILKDLLGRLPYGVVMITPGGVTYTLNFETLKNLAITINGFAEDKPYLRPMSSMTQEEIDEYDSELDKDLDMVINGALDKDRHITSDGKQNFSKNFVAHFGNDWLNAHHFDYRGLIPMGLALEAKEGMYKNE